MADEKKTDIAQFYDEKAFSYDAILEKGFISGMVRDTLQEKLRRIFLPEVIFLILAAAGDDAVYLAERGYKVTGIDVSPGMLDIAKKKIQDKGLNDLVQLHALDAESVNTLGKGVFDGAYSDFNALNHINSLKDFSQSLSEVLKPGAEFYGVMLGRLSLSEISSYMLRLRPGMPYRNCLTGPGIFLHILNSTIRHG